MKTSSGTLLRLLVGHGLCYFSTTIPAIRATTVLPLESETSVTPAAFPVSSDQSPSLLERIPPRVLTSLLSPRATATQSATAFTRGLQWHLAWCPCPRSCPSIPFCTLQPECSFEDSALTTPFSSFQSQTLRPGIRCLLQPGLSPSDSLLGC